MMPQLPKSTPEMVEEAKTRVFIATRGLLYEQPFFGSLLLCAGKEYSDRCRGVGVSVTTRVNLIFNPAYVCGITVDFLKMVLVHECMHVVQRCFDRRRSTDLEEQTIFNLAEDVAINQLIAGMPNTFKLYGKTCLVATIDNFDPEHQFLRKQTTEYYYSLISQMKEEQRKKGGQTVDDHSMQEEGNGEGDSTSDPEVVKQVAKRLVKQAYQRALTNDGMGNLPSEIKALLEKALEVKIDWKNVLRRFVANSAETFKEIRRNKRNRRFGFTVPGEKTESFLQVSVVADTSGSMSDELLADVYAELSAMVKNDVKVKLIHCDVAVHKVEDYKKGCQIEFEGRGGTNMQPGFEEAITWDPDAIICFTDGDIPSMSKFNVPTLWVVYENKSFVPPFGKVVHT